MDGTTANIEVEGSAANNVAACLLNTLGLAPDDIGESDLTVLLDGDAETSVFLHAEGPEAGSITAEMFGGVGWDDRDVTDIAATVHERVESSPVEEDDPIGEAGTGTRDGGAYRPQVTPLVGKVDPEYVEFPGNAPGRLRENTQLHVLAVVMMKWHEDKDAAWVGTGTLADYGKNPMSEPQTQSAASRLFRHKGLSVRRQEPNAGQRKYQYHPTKQLAEEVKRLGDYSIEAVEAKAATHDPRQSSDSD